MFEKEAKEEINKEHWNYSVFKDLAQEYWQKGAEYGYNKALEEATHNYNAIIADYDKRIAEFTKANEWHYVKDGDLPKDNRYILIVTRTDVYRGFYENNNWYGDEGGRLRCIAWKELPELPKEIKE